MESLFKLNALGALQPLTLIAYSGQDTQPHTTLPPPPTITVIKLLENEMSPREVRKLWRDTALTRIGSKEMLFATLCDIVNTLVSGFRYAMNGTNSSPKPDPDHVGPNVSSSLATWICLVRLSTIQGFLMVELEAPQLSWSCRRLGRRCLALLTRASILNPGPAH